MNTVYSIISDIINKNLNNKVIFTRVEIGEIINNNIQNENLKIKNFDEHLDNILTTYYNEYAGKEHRWYIENCIIKSTYDNEKIMNPNTLCIKPITLDIYNIKQQSLIFENFILQLNNKIKNLSIEEYNDKVHIAGNNINNFVEKEVFISLSGRKRVEAASNHAKQVYETYLDIINAYREIKHEIQQFFYDFSELRDNLKYLREDFFTIVKIIAGENLTEEELKLLSFEEIKWLEYAQINEKLNLKYDKIQNKCSTFFDLNKHYLKNISDVAEHGVNKIINNRNRDNLKNDIGSAVLMTGIATVTNLIASNEDATKTVAELRKETEILKQYFHQDKIKLQRDTFRLIELYNEIKNIFIPVTNKFKELFLKIISEEYVNILKDPKTKSLLTLRSQQLQRIKDLELIINEKLNIKRELKDIFENKRKDFEEYKRIFEFAEKQQPDKPNTKTKILTFGYSTIYFPYYHKLWRVEYDKARINFETSYDVKEEKFSSFKLYETECENLNIEFNNLKLENLKTEENLKKHIKENNPQILNLFKNKINELSNIAETSKLVLEQSIHEKLKDPESFKNSLSILNDIVNKKNIVLQNESPSEIDIDQILNFVKNNSSFKKLTQKFLANVSELYPKIDINMLNENINILGQKFKLDTYDLEEYRDNFINYIITNTKYNETELLNKNQLLELGNRAISYLRTSALVYKLKKESEKIAETNELNQQDLDHYLKEISLKLRSEIDVRLENTKFLFQQLEIDGSVNEKIKHFNNFLKK